MLLKKVAGVEGEARVRKSTPLLFLPLLLLGGLLGFVRFFRRERPTRAERLRRRLHLHAA